MSMIPHQPAPGQGTGSPELLQELKSEVTEEAAPLLQFLLNHAVTIMAGLVLFVIVLLGIGVYRWHGADAFNDGQNELARIVLTTQGDDRLNALRAFADKAPSSMAVAARLELAAGAAQEKQYAVAAEAYGAAAAADLTSPAGCLASFNQAQALLAAGKPQDALTVLDALLPRLNEDNRARVWLVHAETALAAGKTDVALKSLETLAAKAQGAEKDYLEGRIFALRASSAARN